MFVKVTVIAGAKKESIRKVSESRYEISVKDPAQRNLANTRVRELIAALYQVGVPQVRIVNGHHSPSKMLSIIHVN